MKNLHAVLTLFLVFALACTLAQPSYADDFANTPIGKQLIDMGIKFLDDPGDFFFNLHTNNEDLSPLPKNRHAAIRLNFFPTTLPFTWSNLNAKVKIKNDAGYWPQIDVSAEYGNILALQAVKSSNDDGREIKPSFTDYSLGAIASKSMNDRTRLFGGIKYASVNMDVTFSTPVVLGAFNMSSLHFKVADTSFFMGISQQTGDESFTVAQIGYGLKYNKITSRIMLCHPHFELGMDIFPEGLLVLQPFMAWHWYF
jgi:hypothetical protein